MNENIKYDEEKNKIKKIWISQFRWTWRIQWDIHSTKTEWFAVPRKIKILAEPFAYIIRSKKLGIVMPKLKRRFFSTNQFSSILLFTSLLGRVAMFRMKTYWDYECAKILTPAISRFGNQPDLILIYLTINQDKTSIGTTS